MSWALESKNDSMLNTPNTYGIYMAGLGFEWLKGLGGVNAIYEQNKYKAGLLYDFQPSLVVHVEHGLDLEGGAQHRCCLLYTSRCV